MTLTNNEIYIYAKNLIEAFNDKDQKLPIKINFYLQKNKNILIELAGAIEIARIEIAKNYGTLDTESQQYIVPPEKIEEVNKELTDLLSLEQEVQIYMINIDNLSDDISLTTAQMEAIMFMIEQ
jgi:hypothetical protein